MTSTDLPSFRSSSFQPCWQTSCYVCLNFERERWTTKKSQTRGLICDLTWVSFHSSLFRLHNSTAYCVPLSQIDLFPEFYNHVGFLKLHMRKSPSIFERAHVLGCRLNWNLFRATLGRSQHDSGRSF